MARPKPAPAQRCGGKSFPRVVYLTGPDQPGHQEEQPRGPFMRSFEVCQCGAPLSLIEAPTPQPTGTQVLLKVLAAGVCHSDLHLSDGYFDLGGGKKLSILERGMKLPATLGHENVG